MAKWLICTFVSFDDLAVMHIYLTSLMHQEEKTVKAALGILNILFGGNGRDNHRYPHIQ